MWADALLRAEQLHLLRIMAWGALSVVVGTGLAATRTVARLRDTMLSALGLPLALAALGAVEILWAGAVYRSATLTDASGAARLQNLAWFQLGLFAGCAIAGALVAVVARRATMPRIAGAAIALTVHGAALVVLTSAFLPIVSR